MAKCQGTVKFAKGTYQGAWKAEGTHTQTNHGLGASIDDELNLTMGDKTLKTHTKMEVKATLFDQHTLEIVSGWGSIDGGDQVALKNHQKKALRTTGKSATHPTGTKGTINSTEDDLTVTVDLSFG